MKSTIISRKQIAEVIKMEERILEAFSDVDLRDAKCSKTKKDLEMVKNMFEAINEYIETLDVSKLNGLEINLRVKEWGFINDPNLKSGEIIISQKVENDGNPFYRTHFQAIIKHPE
jgi:hypothetical protein